ncbi:unnamed protein product [Blepharisma stoltei]|uniref:J domain-containing protein n=1 Tax=Blepharisma stoltei TaxID=1481888 RepID=A0AAU9JA16_9CILI|nr:unnamed protein product [Blepharisma stoltei]
MEVSNLYDLLGIARTASQEEVKKGYRKSCLVHHPDKGGDPEMFKDISKAFETLSDPRKRALYDQQLDRTNSSDGANPQPRSDKRQATKKQKTQPGPPQSESGPSEIPQNPENLSVKELKSLLSSLGIRHDDCVEKAELLQRLRERKNKAKRKTATNPSSISQLAIKILSIGDPECGKSCIIKRYCEGRFVNRYISTIGVDYGVKKLTIQNVKVAINFFDLSGQQDYEEIRRDFYRDSQGVLLVFELNDKNTFNNLTRWEREARSNGLNLQEVDVVVCGNKVDLNGREVTAQEANKWSSSRGYKYFDVSANNGQGISEALDSLFASVVSRNLRNRESLLSSLI